jgi:hypothetical protein
MALAGLLVPVAPALAPAAAVGGVAGGIFPDLDLALAHRRTLHFPVYYWIPAGVAAAAAVLAPGPVTVAAAAFFVAAALHSAADALGGGLELRPWEATSDRGVYLHHRGTWLRPRRWVRYDGAPEDLALAALLSVPSILLFDGGLRALAVAGLVVSTAYTLLRKRLPEWTPERFR